MEFSINDIQRLRELQGWINHSVKEFLTGNNPRDVMQGISQDLRGSVDMSSGDFVEVIKSDLLQRLDELHEDDLGTFITSFVSCLDGEYMVANAFIDRGGTDVQEANTIDEDAAHYFSELKDVHDRIQGIEADDLDIDAVAQQLIKISKGYRPTFEWISSSINSDILAAKEVEASDAKAKILSALTMVWDSLHDSF